MCLYPRLFKNPKYKPNKKNGGVVPPLLDKRVMAIPVGCGKCMACRRKASREWAVRLSEDCREYKDGKFVTFSFNNESLKKLGELAKGESYYEEQNDIARIAVRRFLERWRKKYKKSVRHWMITELGGKRSRIHLHGVLYTNENTETIEKIWKYGHVFIGHTYNEKSINYMVKYMYKVDNKHKGFVGKKFSSAGIGSGYIKRADSKSNVYKKGKTNELYVSRQGRKMTLPIYYRNKIYSEEEKEKLWLEKLDKEYRYINGVKVKIEKGSDNAMKVLKEERRRSKKLGYGELEGWKAINYIESRRKLIDG